MDKNAKTRIHNFSIINPAAGQAITYIFAAENKEDLQKWMEAFWQHFFDLSKLTFGFSTSIFIAQKDAHSNLNIKIAIL